VQTSALLERVPKGLSARIDEILVTALLATIRDWTCRAVMLVDLEGHGRNEIFSDVDISRTIGWFTALYPVLLQGATDATLGVLLEGVKQQLRAVPANQFGYGMARYFREDPEVVAMPSAPLLFNYLGDIDRILPYESWKPLLRDNGPERNPRAQGPHLIEIEGMVFEGQFHLRWAWDPDVFTGSTIERVTQWYRDNLLRLLQLSSESEMPRFQSSDFPAARIDQHSLDALVARIRS
jgi:microcystin synthetase protein McyA